MTFTSVLSLFIMIPRLLAILDAGKHWNLCFRVIGDLKYLGILVSTSALMTYICRPN